MKNTVIGAARFKEGIAIVAGGSGGLGAKICSVLADMGSDVAFTYHHGKHKAMEVQADIEARGRRAHSASVDLQDSTAVNAFIVEAAEKFGRVHTAIYAAGPFIDLKPLRDIDPSLFQRTVSTDLFGCYNFLHGALPWLIEAQGVAVALTTPVVDRFAPTDLLSGAPKAAVAQIIRAIARENGPDGVRANCVGVGLTGDGMVQQLLAANTLTPEHSALFVDALPIRRMGTADDIANAVAFLASDLASYITGQTLMVDGGFSV